MSSDWWTMPCLIAGLLLARNWLESPGSVRQWSRLARDFDIVAGMTAKALKEVLQRVETWPQEDQEALAEYARELEARRTGLYRLTDDERAAVREGLEQARRGEFVPDEEMDEFWRKNGVI